MTPTLQSAASAHRSRDRRGAWAHALGKTFLNGLVAVLPITITVYAILWLASGFEAWLGALLRLGLPDSWYRPGMGLALGMLAVLVIGVLLRTAVAQRFSDGVGSALQRIPIVKTVYGPLRDLMRHVGEEHPHERWDQAVRVTIGDTGISMVGFLTRERAEELTGLERDEGSVAVYLPMSYQIGGYMLVVPRKAVTELDLGVEEMLRMTLTAGMSVAPREAHPPEAPPREEAPREPKRIGGERRKGRARRPATG